MSADVGNSIAGKTVLIVDDEEDLREILVAEFEDQGATVFQASSGTSAFEKSLQEKIDIIVSDIRMPGGDGVALLEKIKARNPIEPVVILISGFSDYTKEQIQNKGAYTVLTKPISPADVVECARKALEKG